MSFILTARLQSCDFKITDKNAQFYLSYFLKEFQEKTYIFSCLYLSFLYQFSEMKPFKF